MLINKNAPSADQPASQAASACHRRQCPLQRADRPSRLLFSRLFSMLIPDFNTSFAADSIVKRHTDTQQRAYTKMDDAHEQPERTQSFDAKKNDDDKILNAKNNDRNKSGGGAICPQLARESTACLMKALDACSGDRQQALQQCQAEFARFRECKRQYVILLFDDDLLTRVSHFAYALEVGQERRHGRVLAQAA